VCVNHTQAFDRYSVLGAAIAPLLRTAVASRSGGAEQRGEGVEGGGEGEERVPVDDAPPAWLVAGLEVLRAAGEQVIE
jgi:hypothetical protein